MSWLAEYLPEWGRSCPRRGAPGIRLPAFLRVRPLSDARTWTLLATILGSSMAFIDTSVVNVALPTIGRDLGLGLTGREWVFLSYSLTLASLYLVGGATGDRLGHRRVFTWGVVGFTAASALAGAAPNGGFLIGARALQGVAGAFLTTGSLATLRAAYGNESGRAVGTWTAWTGITSIAGPPLGGALTQYVSWRAIFFINVPVAALVLVSASRGVKDEAAVETGRPFDVIGAALVAIGFGSLTYALVEGSSRGIGAVAWAIPVAALGLAGFVVREAVNEAPILPLRLFRNRIFAGANLETLLVYAGLGGSSFFLALYLQTVIGYSPLGASLVMLPVSLIMLVLAGTFGALADRHGPRLYLTLGPALIGGGIVLWGSVATRSDWPTLAAGVAVYSVGLSMTVAPITATALRVVPAGLAGIASGVNNTLSRLGNLLAVAGVGLAISLAYSSRAPGSTLHPLAERPTSSLTHAASVDAFRIGMVVAAALAVAGGIVAALTISNAEAKEG